MRRASMVVMAWIAGCAVAAPARALDGLEVGVATGYGMPLGDVDGEKPLTYLSNGAVPLQLEAGLRFAGAYRAGLYAAWGYSRAGDLPDAYEDVHGSRVDLGLALEWRGARGRLLPWASVSAGWEWLTTSGELPFGSGPLTVETTANGPEAALAGGVLFALRDGLAAGPFLALRGGRFQDVAVSYDGDAVDAPPFGDEAFHGWLELGVRGTFGR